MHRDFLALLRIDLAGARLLDINPKLAIVLLRLGIRLAIGIFKEAHLLLLVGNDRGSAWLPTSGANLTVLVGILEALNDTKSLVNVAADGVVVDLHASDLVFVIKDEDSANGSSIHRIFRVSDEHAIITANLLADVCQQRVSDLATEAALTTRRLHPRQMSEVRVS